MPPLVAMLARKQGVSDRACAMLGEAAIHNGRLAQVLRATKRRSVNLHNRCVGTIHDNSIGSKSVKSYAASDFKSKIGEMFMAATKEPVQITQRMTGTFVLMSEEQFRRFEAQEGALLAARTLKATKRGFVATESAERLLQALIVSTSA